MDAASALETLSSLLTSLADSPYSLVLHSQHIQLASQPFPDLAGQFDSAVQLFLDFYAATDAVWLPFLQEKIRELGIDDEFETSDEPALVNLQEIRVEAVLNVLELFRKAENDYLSIPIMQKKIKLLMLLHASYVSPLSNSDFESLLSEDEIRSAIADTVSKGTCHLTKGHLLGQLQIAWELACLDSKDQNSEEREVLKAHIEALHLERLQQPHSTHDETLQSYSSFISAYYSPNEYESHLVSASKIRTGPARAWDKKARYELTIAHSPSRDAYNSYISSEQRVQPQNPGLLNTLFERAIAEYANKRWDAISDGSDRLVVEDLENSLKIFWCDYIDSVRATDDEKHELQLIQRAVRSVPGSGNIWARYIRAVERAEDDADNKMEDDTPPQNLSSVYAQALSTSLVQQQVEQITPLVLAKAGFEKRRQTGDQAAFQELVKTLEDGISLVRHAAKDGDPRMTLEKYLAGVYLNLETPLTDQALALWQSTAKYYKTSYLAWSKYSELLIDQRKYTRARTLFKDVSFKTLDWPEALWQAWMEFEHLHGSVEDIEHCLDKVKGLSAKLAKRRAQETAEAQRAWIQASQVSIGPEHTQASTEDVATDQMLTTSIKGSPHSDRKRKAEEPGSHDIPKRAKLDDKTNLKRDRENSTVFVSGLVTGSTEDDLTTLFKDCGKIREIKITKLVKSPVATVEFFERESVPAALTKDKKRIHNEEIAVHLAWQSTLYVTNFPEKADDASIRELFGPHGEIFDVRWPSKKYKNTRRFCYVQYLSPSEARSALSLHGHELEPERKLTVYISNPERKQDRSDATANTREIYVAGLSKSVNQNELKRLFEKFGTIVSVRMALDDNGNSKGFAFVEFDKEEFANAALAANNQELKKRRIAVTLADTRVQPRQRNEEGASSSQARRSRTLRVKNLPPGTQEGLLQQALEKYTSVKRVEVFKDRNDAIVELTSVAEAGKLLLTPNPIIFGDRNLEFIEEDLPAYSRQSAKTGPLFTPRTAGRPRAGIGSKKNIPKKATSSMPQEAEKGQDDFRRMLNPSI